MQKAISIFVMVIFINAPALGERALFLLGGVLHTRATALGLNNQIEPQSGAAIEFDVGVPRSNNRSIQFGFSGFKSSSWIQVGGSRTELDVETFYGFIAQRFWTPGDTSTRGYVDIGPLLNYVSYDISGSTNLTPFSKAIGSRTNFGLRGAFGVRFILFDGWGLQGQTSYEYVPEWEGLNTSSYRLVAGFGKVW
jgi:hypothetical protein